MERIPVEDNWADVFVSYETIEHVTEDIQRKFLKEIRRILKKDGILKEYFHISDDEICLFHYQYSSLANIKKGRCGKEVFHRSRAFAPFQT